MPKGLEGFFLSARSTQKQSMAWVEREEWQSRRRKRLLPEWRRTVWLSPQGHGSLRLIMIIWQIQFEQQSLASMLKNRLCHRKYRKAHSLSPDEQIFSNYLLQRGYHQTLQSFRDEIGRLSQQGERDLLLRTFDQHPDMEPSEFQQFVHSIEALFQGEDIEKLELKFLLHIWYCGNKIEEIPQGRLKLLKQFIEEHGSSLTEVPVMLPYFALPYVDRPLEHSFLKRIGSDEWRRDIRKLLENGLGSPQPGNNRQEQNEWLDIVKDLIQISLHLHHKCEVRDQKQVEMIERVKKYQQVLRDNEISLSATSESMRPSELSRLANNAFPEFGVQLDKSHSLSELSIVENASIPPLNFEALKGELKAMAEGGKEEEMCTLLHQLNNRILACRAPGMKSKVVAEYVHADLLSLKSKEHAGLIASIEGLKLVQSMCFFEVGRDYISDSEFYLASVCERLIELGISYIQALGQGRDASFEEEQVCLVFSILQKASMHKSCFEKIVQERSLVDYIANNYLLHFREVPERVLLYLAAFFMSLSLHREGKQICSGIEVHGQSLFEFFIKVWLELEGLVEDEQNLQEIESFIYSILYMMLSEPKIKEIARTIGFQETIHAHMVGKGEEYHTKIAQHLMEQLQTHQHQDVETETESDDSEILQDVDQTLWVGEKVMSKEDKPDILRRYVEGRQMANNHPKDEEYDPAKYAGWKRIRASEVKWR